MEEVSLPLIILYAIITLAAVLITFLLGSTVWYRHNAPGVKESKGVRIDPYTPDPIPIVFVVPSEKLNPGGKEPSQKAAPYPVLQPRFTRICELQKPILKKFTWR